MDINSNIALIGLDEAKEYLKISESNSDQILGALINGISLWVKNFLARNLVMTTYTEYYNGLTDRELILRNYPITSITSIHEDSLRQFGSSTVINVSSDVMVQNDSAILRAWNNKTHWLYGYAVIKVVYISGYTTSFNTGTMPEDIRLAVKRILDHQYRTGYSNRKLDVASQSIGEVTTTFRDGDIPLDAKEILKHHINKIPSPQFCYAD